eukprot:g1209.t1
MLLVRILQLGSKDFYFSYSYELSRTMQQNLADAKRASHGAALRPLYLEKDVRRWNHFHMTPFLQKERWQHWCLSIIHGFFAQTRCSSFGWSFSVALIARRSRFYAGTRLNVDGQVGNDVETEQLLCDESTRHLACGHVMSFVQIRGSVPLFWSQEAAAYNPKPPVVYPRCDPTLSATRRHFVDLLERYGTPQLVVNLMKAKKAWQLVEDPAVQAVQTERGKNDKSEAPRPTIEVMKSQEAFSARSAKMNCHGRADLMQQKDSAETVAGTTGSGGSLRSSASCGASDHTASRHRILVTGATGLLGRQVMQVLGNTWEVLGVCKRRALPPRIIACDLTQEKALWSLMEHFRPEVVLHLAGEWCPEALRQAPDQVRRLNVDAAGAVAAACEKFKAWLVHMSADCVFDGTEPPYSVESRANPLSEYGWHKLHSEQLVQAACPKAAILRVPLLYGPVESPLDSAVTSLYTDLQNDIREVDAWQRCYPTWAGDVANVLKVMTEMHFSGERIQGIYHWQGNEQFTWHEMMLLVAETSGLDASCISAVHSPPATPLPRDTRLDCSRLIRLLERALTKVRRGERIVRLFQTGPGQGTGDSGAADLAKALVDCHGQPKGNGLVALRLRGHQAKLYLETPLGIGDFVEHLEKFPVTRIGRVCDFTASGQRYQAERNKGKGLKGTGKGKGPIQALQPGKDEEGFSLVDSRPVPGKSTGRGRSSGMKGKGKSKGIASNYQEGILGQKQKPYYQELSFRLTRSWWTLKIVQATDHVLACLVAAARSVYSWDIVVSKVANKLIFDKRDGSQIDFLTVNETAQDPPNADDKESCVASGAYRYRKITLPGNPKAPTEFEQNPVKLVVRTEESQRGACLATELKNNAFKLGRWTAQAILAGCDTIKIGYVSRQHPKDPWSHSLLGVQTYTTSSFAEQIGLTRNNMFGIIRNIVDLIMGWEDGKYLLLKDPTKSVLRIHEVPWDTFQDDDEDEEADEEEDSLAASEKMHTIDVSGNRISDFGMIQLSKALLMASKMRILDLSGNKFGDQATEELAKALPPNLEELDLTGKGTVEVPKWATLENESRTIRQSDWA